MNTKIPPIGIFNSIKDWIAKDGQYVNGVIIKDIYPETPVLSKKSRPPCPSSWYPNELESGYVALIPNGRVWGKNGSIITPDNYLIWDVSFEGVHITPETHSIFQEKALPEVSHIKNAADITHVHSRNYYHWMYEVIPRIHLIQQCGFPVDQFIVNFEPEHPFHSETLHQLGIEKEQLLPAHRSFHIQAENLITPLRPMLPTKWGYDFLRKIFIKDSMLETSVKKRIFITRNRKRQILNEDQLMEVLSKYGFVTVRLESLSVAEQVQLFSSAEAVIAAHGAGLTNLTFCQPRTRVLEIFPSTYIIPHYWAISSIAQLEYYYFIGEPAGKKSRRKKRWPGGHDISIDIPKFKDFLDTTFWS